MGAFQAQYAIFFLALAAFVKKKYVRWGLYAIALTSIYCLILTLSRGSYFGFLFGVMVLGLIKERKFLLMLVILVFSWQAIVPRAVQERVLMTYEEEGGLDSSAQERVDLWQDALQVIGQNPVLGTGFDTYKFMGRVGPYQDTHNYYLKVFLELGLVGFLLFCWLIVSAFRLAWRLFRSPCEEPLMTALGCALVATLSCTVIVNFFGDRWSYLQVNGFLWVLLGMAARGLWLHKEEGRQVKVEVASKIRSSSPRIPLPVSHA
jgi:O-antigen ligase